METLNSKKYLDFLTRLFKEEIIIIGPKTKLKDSSLSPIYIDLRDRMWASYGLLPTFGRLFATLISELIPERHRFPHLVCGIPEAANPLATAAVIAGQELGMDLQLVALRQQPKAHGTGSQSFVIGKYEKNGHLYLIDDVVTTSQSKRDAIDKLVQSGFPKEEITVIVAFDRQQGGLESLKRDGIRTASLFKILDVAQTFADEKIITSKQHRDVRKFIANNQHC
ncbi:MAG: hypothetical protein V1668_01460 [Patescibacteria group bacterium]